jgi:hypothetical protein
MFYFPIGQFPEWLPFLGGHTFFEPVFNIADAAISTGVIWILLFQRRYFADTPSRDEQLSTTNLTTENQTLSIDENEQDTTKPDAPSHV